MKKLFALRAAACAQNTAESITESTLKMCSELFLQNNLSTEDFVSLHFSITNDLDEQNPCAALRKKYSGNIDISAVPLFCTQEAFIKGALPSVIRLIAYVYMDEKSVPVHIYTQGAEVLRPDLTNVSSN